MPGKINSFVSSPRSALDKALNGFVALHPALRWDKDQNVMYRAATDRRDRVTVLSGGGSGHEPAHAGFVGEGMLDAAVCGAVFASPNVLQIEAGLRLVQSPHGILIVVKNYTGDKLNFTLAAERFRFASGIPVRIVVVADDVSIGRTNSALVGRRGLAGTVLAHKIAGAASSARLSLDEVADAVEFALMNMATIGAGLDSSSLPGQCHQPRLGLDEVELGIGIHNEPGSRCLRPRPPLEVLVRGMLCNIFDDADKERNYLAEVPRPASHDIVLLMNNLGGLSALEMVAVTGEVTSQLGTDYRINPRRVYTGTFLSALDCPGFSISILVLPRIASLSSRILEWLDAPTDALGWTCGISSHTWNDYRPPAEYLACEASISQQAVNPGHIQDIECEQKVTLYSPGVSPLILSAGDSVLFTNIIESVHLSLIAAEPEITRMDTIMGDGDCGTTLLDGSGAVMMALRKGDINTASISSGMMAVANTIARSMGGTSGALYAVFFTAFASAICGEHSTSRVAAFPSLVRAAGTAMSKLQQVTAARAGDRTMMDALIPFVETLAIAVQNGRAPLDAFEEAVKAARSGSETTKSLKPKFGRSTYVSAEGADNIAKGIPDPGAYGVVAIVAGILDALKCQHGI
ncbi:dihydroxyacetone kinase Dak1 [Hypomontagnella monticulosa]|nr:dihydroxyacetone kinase Dak1 [Hypomontagnella monticulosa]